MLKLCHPKDHWTLRSGYFGTLPLTGSNPSIGGCKILRAGRNSPKIRSAFKLVPKQAIRLTWVLHQCFKGGHYVINPNKALLYGKSLQNYPTFPSSLIQKNRLFNGPLFQLTALGVQLRPPKSRKKSAQASFGRPRDQWKLHATTWSWCTTLDLQMFPKIVGFPPNHQF